MGFSLGDIGDAISDIGGGIVDFGAKALGGTSGFMNFGATGGAMGAGLPVEGPLALDAIISSLALGGPSLFAGGGGGAEWAGMGGFGDGFMPGAGSAPGIGLPGIGSIQGVMSMLSGLMGMDNARRQRNLAQDALSRSDPFGPNRAQYAQRLNNLYMNPGSVADMPGFKAGMQAVERRMAAQGFNGSGNMATSLMDYGNKFFGDEVARLSSLAGADMKPDASQLLRGEQIAHDSESQSMGSIMYGLKDLLPIIAKLGPLMGGTPA